MKKNSCFIESDLLKTNEDLARQVATFYRQASLCPHHTNGYRKFKCFDSRRFRNDINSQDGGCIDQFDDPNNVWRTWKDVSIKVVDKHAPLCSKRVQAKSSPWITSQLKQHMYKRDALKLNLVKLQKMPQFCKYWN